MTEYVEEYPDYVDARTLISAEEFSAAQSAKQQQLLFLQKTFPVFVIFLQVMRKQLGFKTYDLHIDIGAFLAFGP